MVGGGGPWRDGGLIAAGTSDGVRIDSVDMGGGYTRRFGRRISPGMIDARNGAADSHHCRRVPGVSPVPGVTRGLNTVTLRTENNGRDAETTWLMVRTQHGEWRRRKFVGWATCIELSRERKGDSGVVVEVYDPKAFSINQIKT